MKYIINEKQYFELQLYLAMAQKINDDEICIESGENPVDKQDAIRVNIEAAIRTLEAANESSFSQDEA